MPFRGLKFLFPFGRDAESARRTPAALSRELWRDWRPTLEQWIVWLRERPILDIVYVVGLVLVLLLAAYLLLTATG